MKLCYFGLYEEGYPRNDVFIRALRNTGAEIIECNYRIKPKHAQQLGRISYLFVLVFRFFIAHMYLMFRLAFLEKVDAIIIGYPAHIDVVAFYPLVKLKGIKLFFNPLVSLHDTIITDRKLFSEGSLVSKLLFSLDKAAFSLADAVFWDTQTHSDFIASFFNVDKSKFHVVPAGPEEGFFDYSEAVKTPRFQILYVGKYIPLHSMETIIGAARILKDDAVSFLLVGTGQEYKKTRMAVEAGGFNNIEFVDWMEREEVLKAVKASHVVLGIFKKEGKAMRVVPNKVFEAMAAGAVVITERSPAMLEWFSDGVDVLMVEPENPVQLAEKIRWVRSNYEDALAIAGRGRERVRQFAAEEKIGMLLVDILAREMGNIGRGDM